MLSTNQIRRVINEYISGEMKSKAFLEKFTLLTHNLHKCEDSDAVQLANRVEALLALRTSETISNADLNVELSKLGVIIEVSDESRATTPAMFDSDLTSSLYDPGKIHVEFAKTLG